MDENGEISVKYSIFDEDTYSMDKICCKQWCEYRAELYFHH